jgi:hypothetical protein
MVAFGNQVFMPYVQESTPDTTGHLNDPVQVGTQTREKF